MDVVNSRGFLFLEREKLEFDGGNISRDVTSVVGLPVYLMEL